MGDRICFTTVTMLIVQRSGVSVYDNKIMETNPPVAKCGDQITKIVGNISRHRKIGGGGYKITPGDWGTT